MVSLGNMIVKLSGLIDTKDVNPWENDFLRKVLYDSEHGKKSTSLSEKQAECVERIYNKHFG